MDDMCEEEFSQHCHNVQKLLIMYAEKSIKGEVKQIEFIEIIMCELMITFLQSKKNMLKIAKEKDNEQ